MIRPKLNSSLYQDYLTQQIWCVPDLWSKISDLAGGTFIPMGDGVVLVEGASYNSGVVQSLIFLNYGVAQKCSSITQKSRNPYPNPAFFHFLSDCPASKGPPTTARRLYAIATVDCMFRPDDIHIELVQEKLYFRLCKLVGHVVVGAEL
ncbi:hypothetical protein OROMI_027314 [Orobanche minor]